MATAAANIPAQPDNGGSGFIQSWLPVVIFLIGGLFAIALMFASISDNGKTRQQAIDASPASSQHHMLQDLSRNSDPSTYLLDHLKDITDISNELSVLKDKIDQGKTAKTLSDADKAAALALIEKMQGELTQIAQFAQSDRKKAQDIATQFGLDSQQLIKLVPPGNAQLDVPVVDEGRPEWCGRTAAAMVALYYSKGEVTSKLAPYVTQASNRLQSAGKANFLSPEFLISQTGISDWKYHAQEGKSPDQLFQIIKDSIDGGDPVILYTFGAYYSHNHIVVITGYDEARRVIIVNNPIIPSHGGTVKDTVTSTNGRQLITIDFLSQHLGEKYPDYHGHSFLIRDKYWK